MHWIDHDASLRSCVYVENKRLFPQLIMMRPLPINSLMRPRAVPVVTAAAGSHPAASASRIVTSPATAHLLPRSLMHTHTRTLTHTCTVRSCPSALSFPHASSVSLLISRAQTQRHTYLFPHSRLHTRASPSTTADTSSIQAIPQPTDSHSSSQRRYGLFFTVMAAAATAATVSALTEQHAVCEPSADSRSATSKVRSTARGVSELDPLSLDFRTLGVMPCPPLPPSAPRWLHDLSRDSDYQYRDLGAILDTCNHLLYDGLSGDGRIGEVYYFAERRLTDESTSKDTKPAASSSQAQSESQTTLVANGTVSTPNSSAASSDAANPSARAFSTPSSPTPTTGSIPIPGPEIRAVFHLGSRVCGHAGIVHGGCTAALMDEVAGAATFCAAGGGHFTANLNINYLAPIRSGQYVLVRAQAVKQERRKLWINISVEDGRGQVFARATALFVKAKMMPPAVMLAATQ